MDQTNFEHHVTNLAVDARISRSDLDYIVGNLQQPPPPSTPPPPPNDAAADRARLIAELDGLAQERGQQPGQRQSGARGDRRRRRAHRGGRRARVRAQRRPAAGASTAGHSGITCRSLGHSQPTTYGSVRLIAHQALKMVYCI